MIDRLIDWVSGIGPWAYVAIFAVVSLESAAFLGFVMPGEALVLLGGFLASCGKLDLRVLIPLVAGAAILGDSVGYELGRRLGKPWFLRYGRRIGLHEPQWQRLEDFFHRHGGKMVFFARFSAFFRILVPFFAGAARLAYPQFLKWNVAGGIIWAAASVLLGYVAGESWRELHRRVGHWAILLVLMLVVVLLVFRFARRRPSGGQ